MTQRLGGAASVVCAPLIGGPRQPLHVAHRCVSSLQLADDSGRVVMCLLTTHSLRLPHGVVASTIPSRSAAIWVGSGSLGWAGSEVRITRWWAPARPSLPQLRALVDDGAVQEVAAGWRSGLGRGDGLTPYADDVLCGGLVTLSAAGHPAALELGEAVRSADLETATAGISAALLRCAAAGWCIDQLAAYLRLRALDAPAGELARAEAALSAVGQSSGRGLVEGVCRMVGPAGGVAEDVAA